MGPGAGIVCNTSADISLQSLKVTHHGQSGILYSALVIRKSQNISLINVQFQGPDFSQGFSRVITITHSHVTVMSCSFLDGGSHHGGAIDV